MSDRLADGSYRMRRRYFYVHQGPLLGFYYAKSIGAGATGVEWVPDGPFNTEEEAWASLNREIDGIVRSYGVEPQDAEYNGHRAIYLEYKPGTARPTRRAGKNIHI